MCQVAEISIELAKKYELNIEKCIIASLLHDISVIMIQDQMYAFAKENNWTIDLAEEKNHFLLHQRLSRVIAQKEFCILDEEILSAIECHTTLKKIRVTMIRLFLLRIKSLGIKKVTSL